ncbi:MAG: VWA domain-containing protein, partial [Myxococcota bacterium]
MRSVWFSAAAAAAESEENALVTWRLRPGLLGLLGLGLGVASGCTPDQLQAIDEVEVRAVDDLLRIDGEVCSAPPRETDFPVKILFVIDGSGSMQFVDNPGQRALAVEEVLLRLRANPSVSFAVIRFNESDAVLTKPGAEINAGDPLSTDLTGAFTRDPAVLSQAVQGLRVADSVTDYQGALSASFLILSQDMLQAPRDQLARTKYVVIFLSDGDPFPTCCSQSSEMAGLCTRDTNIFFCENPNAIRQNPTQLPFLERNEDYNQPYQIEAAVQDIMDLQETFGVGELRLHSAFLFDPTLVSQLVFNPQRMEDCFEIAGVNFVCPDSARRLLGGMARIGQGIFRDFSAAEEIDFLGFDQLSIRRENALKNLIVENRSVVIDEEGVLEPDTDGDGLGDSVEFAAGLSRVDDDSDDDGFSDLLETRLARGGFDPEEPTPGCTRAEDRADLDADGLR